MPDLKTHLFYDRMYFGDALTAQYGWVNIIMDRPFTRLFGVKHRKVLHNKEGVAEITRLFGFWAGTFAALHIYIDREFSYYKRRENYNYGGKKERQRAKANNATTTKLAMH